MYTFDLSGDRMRKLQFFPDAAASFEIPTTLEDSLSILVWGVGAFSFAGSRMGRPGINVFVVQGIVLVSAAVVLVR